MTSEFRPLSRQPPSTRRGRSSADGVPPGTRSPAPDIASSPSRRRAAYCVELFRSPSPALRPADGAPAAPMPEDAPRCTNAVFRTKQKKRDSPKNSSCRRAPLAVSEAVSPRPAGRGKNNTNATVTRAIGRNARPHKPALTPTQAAIIAAMPQANFLLLPAPDHAPRTLHAKTR